MTMLPDDKRASIAEMERAIVEAPCALHPKRFCYCERRWPEMAEGVTTDRMLVALGKENWDLGYSGLTDTGWSWGFEHPTDDRGHSDGLGATPREALMRVFTEVFGL